MSKKRKVLIYYGKNRYIMYQILLSDTYSFSIKSAYLQETQAFLVVLKSVLTVIFKKGGIM